MEQIKSAGALRKMQNRALAEKISAYDAFTYHLEEDFAYDREIGRRASELAHQVVDRNYPGLNEILPAGMLGQRLTMRERLLELCEGVDRQILTDDIRAISVAVNSFAELGGNMGLNARIQVEIPRLIADAEELIELLKAEYPE